MVRTDQATSSPPSEYPASTSRRVVQHEVTEGFGDPTSLLTLLAQCGLSGAYLTVWHPRDQGSLLLTSTVFFFFWTREGTPLFFYSVENLRRSLHMTVANVHP